MEIKIAPSILSADFSRLGEQVAEVTKAGADYIHVDVMDGQFVPPITLGAGGVASLRSWTDLPLDVHLMIHNPERQIESFVRAGANIITVHAEACLHLHRVIQEIKLAGIKAGLAINPSTSLTALDEILPVLDMVVVMTVNPGYGGQSYIPEMTGKIARLRQILDHQGLAVELEVDGGITPKVAPEAVKAGARVLVAGAAVFASPEGIAAALHHIRQSISQGSR